MATIQISNLHPTEVEPLFYAELSPEEASQIYGEGWLGGIVGAVVGGTVGATVGFATGISTIGGGPVWVPPGPWGGVVGGATGGFLGFTIGYSLF